MSVMKFVSWNVNGIRACAGKGFCESFARLDADVFCLQETKAQPGQIALELDGYSQYWFSAEKKGYSGVAVFSRNEPLSVSYGIGIPEFDIEGRSITLEFDRFYFIAVYTPNAREGLARIDYRVAWEDAFRAYLLQLNESKPVIFCGDLNVAHNEIDLKNPSTNRGNPGFSDEERGKFTQLLDSGFTDTFRYLYPDERRYSWWSYRLRAREKGIGWRIDYFVVSNSLRDRIRGAYIYDDVFGSDHCPVGLELEI